jgi:hypothetical protein
MATTAARSIIACQAKPSPSLIYAPHGDTGGTRTGTGTPQQAHIITIPYHRFLGIVTLLINLILDEMDTR